MSCLALHLSNSGVGGRVVLDEVTARGEKRVPLLLDMQLQGALLPTVNQGPMAYAHAFLAPDRVGGHPVAKIGRLKKLFL